MSHVGGFWDPVIDVAFFLTASLLIIWRLEAMSARGVEGTILGTLFMPYFSGLGNLLLVYLVLRDGGPGGEVMVNCVVNNATNITLIVGLCALIWPLALGTAAPPKAAGPKANPKAAKSAAKSTRARVPGKADAADRLKRLSLMFTMLAMLFFCGMTWALAADGALNRGDGLTLIGLFLFWQAFHVFEVLKENVRSGSSWHPLIIVDIVVIFAASGVLYFSVEWLVNWILAQEASFFGPQKLGLLTGWLMVRPNAIFALYYA